MKSLVVYDSQFGNTEKIAKTIGETLGKGTQVVHVSKADSVDLKSVDLLIVGSPTQGGKPTLPIQNYLAGISHNGIEGAKAAAFDSRFASKEHGLGLRILMGIINYAAPRIADVLRERGATLVVMPEGFIVENKDGPLKEGELKRAKIWTKLILERSEHFSNGLD